MKDNQNHLKETRLENLETLREAIDNGFFEDLTTPDKEWGGAYVIVTHSSQKKIGNEDDTIVVSEHSLIISKLFHYVKEKVMIERDFHLYGFMALLANDFIREFGDMDDYTPLLDYIASGISFYYKTCEKDRFEIMRFFLSQNISDEDIRKIL